MEFINYFSHVYPILGAELLAALFGSFYLKRVRPQKSDVVFVFFLWFVFFVEFIASYSPIAYMTNYEYFGFVKGTNFERNYWMYNISICLGFIVFTNYFKWNIKSVWHVRLINVLLWLYGITAIVNLFMTDVFFLRVSVYTEVVGTAVLLFSIAVYQLQLVRSEQILNFRRLLPFYISVGATISSLCIVPFSIYGGFFKTSISEDFVQLQANTLLIVNLLVYSIYIFGFIKCLKKKSY